MKKEIHSKSIFGFKYHSVNRIEERLIDINPYYNPCDYIGLYIFKNQKKIITNRFELFTDRWKKTSIELIELAFFKLISNQEIKIYSFKNLSFYFFKSLSYKTNSYFFKTAEETIETDIFCKLLFNTIKKRNKNEIVKNFLPYIINDIVDSYLGKEREHNAPFKEFNLMVLNGYKRGNNFLSYDTDHSSIKSLFNEKPISIDENIHLELNYQLGIIINEKEKMEVQFPAYKKFNEELKEKVEMILRRRRPSSDGGD